jgi:hypothetical protein
MKRFAIAIGGALLGAAGMAGPASATPGFVGSSLTIDGEIFTVASCGGGAVCSSLQMVQDGSNVGVTIDLASGGSIITGTSPNSATDITIGLTVTGSAVIQGVGVSAAGTNSGSSVYSSLAGVGETISNNGSTFSGSASIGQAEQWIATTPGFTSLDITKDVHVLTGTQNVGLPSGVTMTVNAVTQDLQFGVPEPASIALMLAGLAAVAGVRRRNRRRS